MGKTILISLVVAIVVGVAAGFGGYKLGDSAGFARANLVRQQFAQQRQAQGGNGGFGAGGGQGGAGFRAGGIPGVIKSVNGDTLTVTVGQNDMQVKLSTTTQIEKTAPGSSSDLAAGTRVQITADRNTASTGGSTGGTSGPINATTILILPAQ